MPTKLPKFLSLRRNTALGILCAFVVNTVLTPVAPAFAQAGLPLPSSMVNLTSGYNPTLIKGMRFYPENPLRFDFIVTPGDSGLQGQDFENESTKLMKYFLSSLTVPEKDLWVNLSPYEKDRIIPDAYGKTEMGRDMLAQDYILKQLTSSVIYPDSELGKSFWAAVYQKLEENYGSTEDGINTFNKIWIVPEKAVVYSKDNIAYVVESHLKVMLEEDYLAMQKNGEAAASSNDASRVGSKLIRQMILPAIEKEVNEGENFAPLRQVYHSLILATWFKRNLKESILSKVYVGQNKIDGTTFSDLTDKDKIYSDYIEAFKTGIYSIVKEEVEETTGEIIPRKYFSGGVNTIDVDRVLTVTSQVGSSAVLSSVRGANSQPVLIAAKLDRPQVSPKVANAGEAETKNPLNLMRDTRPLDVAQQTIWTGQLSAATDTESSLSMSELNYELISQFQKALLARTRSQNYEQTLKDFKPLIDYLVKRFKSQAELTPEERASRLRRADEIKDKLKTLDALTKAAQMAKAEADSLISEIQGATDFMRESIRQNLKGRIAAAELRYSQMQDQVVDLSLAINERALRKELAKLMLPFEKMSFVREVPKFLNNETPVIRAKEHVQTLATMIAELTPGEIADLMENARFRVQKDLSTLARVKQDALDMNGVSVSFVLNTPEVFAVRTAQGQQSLEIDLMSYFAPTKGPEVIAGRYEFLDHLARQERVAEVKEFGRELQSDFVVNNPEVVLEVLRVLNFMQRVVDPYYEMELPRQIGYVYDQKAAEKFLGALAAVPRYAKFAQLLRTLGAQYTVSVGQKMKTKTPDLNQRIETILRTVAQDTDIQYTRSDIIILSEITINGLSAKQWFSKNPLSQVNDDLFKSIDAESNDELPAAAVFNEESGVQNAVDVDFLADDEPIEDGILHRMVQRLKDTVNRVNERFGIKVQQWALQGAVAMMGLFTLGNIGQAGIESSINQINAQAEYKKEYDAQRIYLKEQAQRFRTDPILRVNILDPSPAFYEIKEGDTLSEIAVKFGKLPVKGALEIAAANPEIIKQQNQIFPGKKIIIPGTTTVTKTLGAEDTSLKKVIEYFYGVATPQNLRKFLEENPEIRTNADLQPGISVVAKISIEQAKKIEEQPTARIQNTSASNMVSSNNVGGIDFDPTGLVIESLGEDFRFDAPIEPGVLENITAQPVNGFVPTILNVIPIVNLSQFLGIQK